MSHNVKLEISYANQDKLEFKIIPEGGWDKTKKLFGHLKEIEVGQPDFDDMFLVIGSDEEKIKKLFSKPHIADFLVNQRRISLEVTPNSLIFRRYLPIGGIDHLKMICDGISEILNELCLMGSGYENQA